MVRQYRNRSEAGRLLALELHRYTDRDHTRVLGLARGGIPVAYEVAKSIHAPLDVFVVRKLGVPGHEELAMGAIASGGMRVLNMPVVRELGISEEVLDAATRREQQELERREHSYRNGRPARDLKGCAVILVDDGLATGTTMRVAVAAVRQQDPAKVVVAVPVGAIETCRQLEAEADEVICAITPANFYAVGMWSEQFDQTSDDEVRELLQRSEATV